MKGKIEIAVARQFGGKQRNFSGENLWARGFAVSTVGIELETIKKKYIAEQEKLTATVINGSFSTSHNGHFKTAHNRQASLSDRT